MVGGPAKWWQVSTAALAGLSLVLVAVAAEVAPPNASMSETPVAVVLDVPVLERYIGDYQLAPTAILTVTRDGEHLFAQLTGQQKAEIFAQSERKFFYKVVKAEVSFESDSTGRTTGLVLHQNGVDHHAPRVDAASAQQIVEALASRIQAQAPLPGSEAAVRRLVGGVLSGTPNYEEMSPELAAAVRQQLPQTQTVLARLGPVVSVEFLGVGNQGWDAYQLKHEHGVSQVKIMLNSKGIITGALQTFGP